MIGCINMLHPVLTMKKGTFYIENEMMGGVLCRFDLVFFLSSVFALEDFCFCFVFFVFAFFLFVFCFLLCSVGLMRPCDDVIASSEQNNEGARSAEGVT